MRLSLLGVVLGLAWLSSPTTARAECGRGASCLSHWHARKRVPPPASAPTSAEPGDSQTDAAAPAALPTTAPAPAPPPENFGPRKWYGWQLLVSDALVASTFAISAAANVRGAAAWAIGIPVAAAYEWVPPIIHWRHGRGPIAWLSLGLRDSIPAVLGVTGLMLSNCPKGSDGLSSTSCLNHHFVMGLYSGMIVASALDVALLARDAPAKTQPSAFFVSPTVSVEPKAATLGVVGMF